MIQRLRGYRDKIEEDIIQLAMYSRGKLTLSEVSSMPYKLRVKFSKLFKEYNDKNPPLL